MKYNNEDALNLIYNRMRWGQFLEKYWHEENVIYVHAKAIAKAYEKVHPIPVKKPTYKKFEEWIKPFQEKCLKISLKFGDNPNSRQYVNEQLFKDYMDKYAGYLYRESSAERDYDLELAYARECTSDEEENSWFCVFYCH